MWSAKKRKNQEIKTYKQSCCDKWGFEFIKNFERNRSFINITLIKDRKLTEYCLQKSCVWTCAFHEISFSTLDGFPGVANKFDGGSYTFYWELGHPVATSNWKKIIVVSSCSRLNPVVDNFRVSRFASKKFTSMPAATPHRPQLWWNRPVNRWGR